MANAARVVAERAPAPFLKWVGGKRQLLSAILESLPSTRIKGYAEAFLGGGAVFFELARLDRIEHAILCDTNAELIDAYRAVKDVPDLLIEALRKHRNDEEYYYEVRALVPEKMSLPEKAARTIYLNRCGYNGLYRVNSAGSFNVPFGKYANPRICDIDGLYAASRALQRADLRVADFAAATAELKRGNVAYFDPPYVPLSASSSFTAYTRDGFTMADQSRLRDVALALKRKSVHVLVSNASAPVVYELYRDGFTCRKVPATRLVNCNGGGRGVVTELLIT